MTDEQQAELEILGTYCCDIPNDTYVSKDGVASLVKWVEDLVSTSVAQAVAGIELLRMD